MSEHMQHAQDWAHEYVMSPVAHRDVVKLIGDFPPSSGEFGGGHEMYSKLMNNVVHHHAQEWFKAGAKDEFHEPAHHMTQWYLDRHNGTSGL